MIQNGLGVNVDENEDGDGVQKKLEVDIQPNVNYAFDNDSLSYEDYVSSFLNKGNNGDNADEDFKERDY
jgi:hypothetical protein